VNPGFVEEALVDEMRFSLATIERLNEQISEAVPISGGER